jgi:hypothetical protein
MLQATLTQQQQDNPTVDVVSSKENDQKEQPNTFKSLAELFWTYTEEASEADTRGYRGIL